MDKPTIGRIVHYFERDARTTDFKIKPFAAIITEVIGGEYNAVMLTLFLPGAVRCVGVPVVQGTSRGCWNWPIKEPLIVTP